MPGSSKSKSKSKSIKLTKRRRISATKSIRATNIRATNIRATNIRATSKGKNKRKSKYKSKRKSKRRRHCPKKTIPIGKFIEYPLYEHKNDLKGKDLQNTVIHGANLSNMSLKDAKLQGTKFIDCNLTNTNFDGAYIDTRTEFIDCRISNCKTANINYVDGAVKEDFDYAFNNSETFV